MTQGGFTVSAEEAHQEAEEDAQGDQGEEDGAPAQQVLLEGGLRGLRLRGRIALDLFVLAHVPVASLRGSSSPVPCSCSTSQPGRWCWARSENSAEDGGTIS